MPKSNLTPEELKAIAENLEDCRVDQDLEGDPLGAPFAGVSGDAYGPSDTELQAAEVQRIEAQLRAGQQPSMASYRLRDDEYDALNIVRRCAAVYLEWPYPPAELPFTPLDREDD